MSSQGSANKDTVQPNILPAPPADLEANGTQSEADAFDSATNGVNASRKLTRKLETSTHVHRHIRNRGRSSPSAQGNNDQGPH